MILPLTQPSVTLSPSNGERDGVKGALSDAARRRILSRPGEPLFLADWKRVLMIFSVNLLTAQS